MNLLRCSGTADAAMTKDFMRFLLLPYGTLPAFSCASSSDAARPPPSAVHHMAQNTGLVEQSEDKLSVMVRNLHPTKLQLKTADAVDGDS